MTHDWILTTSAATRACVNPEHLEPVTRKVNSLRGISPTIQLHLARHCKKGHDLDEVGTYVTLAFLGCIKYGMVPVGFGLMATAGLFEDS